MELSPDAIFLHQDGRVVSINPAGIRLFGARKVGDVVGRPVLDLVHEDSREFVRKRIQLSYEQRTPIPLKESTILTITGTPIHVEATSTPVAMGGRPATLVLLRDITERKAAEDSLRRSEERFRIIAETSPDLIFQIDASGQILYCSPSVAQYGYQPQTVEGTMFSEYVDPGSLDIALRVFRRAMGGESVHMLALRLLRADGTLIDGEVSAAPLITNGATIGIQGIYRDVSERRRAEEITQARLRLVEMADTHPLDELLVATLDETEKLTKSTIGFLHYLESDQRTLALQVWSTRTTGDLCRAEGKGRHYDVSDAGVWVDCIRQRRPVIHNDYASMPHRKGLPPDHAPVVREMVVPVFRGDRIVAILGVGNKGHDYTDADIEIAWRMADIAWDITERKRAEEALQHSHEELERRVLERTAELTTAHARTAAILESIRDGFFTLDNEWRLTYVNTEATRIWGVAREEVIGRSVWDIAPGARGTVFEEQYRKALAGQAPVVFEARSPLTERWMEVRAYPSGSGLAVYFHDITERRDAEAERIRLAAAVASAGEAVVITDRTGRIQYVNPAFEQVTGYARADAEGGTLHLLDSGRHDEAFYQEIRDALQRDGVWRGRLINRKKDGTLYFEYCVYSVVAGDSGEIANYISIRRDETERLRLESIASAVNTMENIGYIFSGVRHEIGNPINTAKMALSVLLHKLEGASKDVVVDYVSRALGELRRVERLLKSLKTFNLYETMAMQGVATASFLEDFLVLITPDLGRKRIAVTSSIGAGAELLIADPRALHQVLLNIVTNATDALEGREEGRIAFKVTAEGRLVRVRIADNGCGMTEEARQHLFRPFYTTKQGGTGLGLMIVRKMVAQMGGSIEIESSPDVGTMVDILLQSGADHAVNA